MKQVPVAAFKDRVSHYIAEAEAGGEIMITRHGKPTVKLVGVQIDRRTKKAEAVARIHALGQRILARHGPTSQEEISTWINEDRP
jgi:prevent-host-death family protein